MASVVEGDQVLPHLRVVLPLSGVVVVGHPVLTPMLPSSPTRLDGVVREVAVVAAVAPTPTSMRADTAVERPARVERKVRLGLTPRASPLGVRAARVAAHPWSQAGLEDFPVAEAEGVLVLPEDLVVVVVTASSW